MMTKLDLWLRSVWALWDTHGTRLLGIAAFVHAATSALVVALGDLSSRTSSVLLAVSAVFGAMTRARGQTNAEH